MLTNIPHQQALTIPQLEHVSCQDEIAPELNSKSQMRFDMN